MGTSGSYGSTGVNDSPLNNPPKTNLEKELVNKKQKTNRDNNIHTDNIDSKLQATFTIRIPYSVYKKYYELGGTKKKLTIDLIRQFIAYVVYNADNIASNVVSNVSVNTNNNTNINVILNINNVAIEKNEEADEFTAERVRQLKLKLKEAQEVLREYKSKAEIADKLLHYIGLYEQGTINAKQLLENVLQLKPKRVRL